MTLTPEQFRLETGFALEDLVAKAELDVAKNVVLDYVSQGHAFLVTPPCSLSAWAAGKFGIPEQLCAIAIISLVRERKLLMLPMGNRVVLLGCGRDS